jgi:transglutaminase-like putative cysteine protease
MKTGRYFVACLAVLAASPVFAEPPRYYMQLLGSRRVVATYRFEVTTTNSAVKEFTFRAMAAPEIAHQTQTSTSMRPAGELSTDLSPARRPMVMTRVSVADPQPPQRVEAEVIYRATLLARRMTPLMPGQRVEPAPPLAPAARELYLAETPTLDFQASDFQTWLDNHSLRRRKEESDIDFARRAFTSMIDLYAFENGQPNRPVSAACLSPKADCDGLGVVFVAAMRANGVPARLLFGIPAVQSLKPNPRGGIEGHAFAEFFAEGVGWTPVEIGSALQHARETNPQQWFGFDPGRLMVQHVDCDLAIPTPGRPMHIYSLHSLFVSVSGKGKMDVRIRSLGWDVEVEPAGN